MGFSHTRFDGLQLALRMPIDDTKNETSHGNCAPLRRGAPRGIHKRNCNPSRTVWENTRKTNETLSWISVAGTVDFYSFLHSPGGSERTYEYASHERRTIKTWTTHKSFAENVRSEPEGLF